MGSGGCGSGGREGSDFEDREDEWRYVMGVGLVGGWWREVGVECVGGGKPLASGRRLVIWVGGWCLISYDFWEGVAIRVVGVGRWLGVESGIWGGCLGSGGGSFGFW